MNAIVALVILVAVLQTAVAPPVIEKKNIEEKEKTRSDEFEEMGIEYNRYLVQVVEALESDKDFRKKLENATSDDIQSGKIAEELDFVAHNVRTQLDEIKRIELERLRKLTRQQFEYENNIDTRHLKIPDPEHVDHSNPHTFEIADLKKLITKTAEDLAEGDKKRREEFKNYEMEKEFEQKQKLKELDEEKKKKYLEEIEEQKQKHKKHEPLHHPGSKQQLEEVWEKQDHMANQEFDPKAFFFMHDLDGNGGWDESEVKALFLKELDKMYEAGAKEDDMRERAEEMERMREHVFREADLDHDGFISYEEFLLQTKKPEFEQDQGWQGLDEQQVYSQSEYDEFERKRQEEIHRLIQEGKLQPPPGYNIPPPPNYYPPPPVPQGQVYAQQQVPVHPNQVPYQQQAQAYQQQQVYQQQQQFQQQQQNNLKQQQQYQQQNPQHYQQQYQPPQPNQQQQNIQQPNQQQFQQQQTIQQPNQQQIQQQQNIQQPNQQQQNIQQSNQQPQNIQQPNQQQNVNQPNQQQFQQQQPILNQQPPIINQQQPLSNDIPSQQQNNNLPPVVINDAAKLNNPSPISNSIPQGPK